MKRSLIIMALAVLCIISMSYNVNAALTTFQTFTGTVAVSTDGFGSIDQTGTISASVPAGATVLGAYLYTAVFRNQAHVGVAGTLNGNPVPYGPPVPNPSPSALGCCALSSARADVTSIVAPVINGGPGGIYNFTVTETAATQDGEALVVVYSLASLPVGTVGILDGFSAVTGDSTAINFSNPLDPTAPGFFAEMRIGDSFSCCGQRSTISVNGVTITDNAGNNDDGLQVADGSLITVGGFDDPFSPLLPSYDADHERYNLVPQVGLGDTSISVFTQNPDATDNIFLGVFHVAGIAGINVPPPTGVPEPPSVLLTGVGLLAVGAYLRRGHKKG
jgi:hypothetical protein